MGGPPDQLPASRPKRRIKKKGYETLALCALAMLFSVWWFTARLFVCWGPEEEGAWLGLYTMFGCRGAQWLVLLALAGTGYALYTLGTELLELLDEALEPVRFRRTRAGWRAYRRKLDLHEQVLIALGVLLWLIGLALVALFLASPVEF